MDLGLIPDLNCVAVALFLLFSHNAYNPAFLQHKLTNKQEVGKWTSSAVEVCFNPPYILEVLKYANSIL